MVKKLYLKDFKDVIYFLQTFFSVDENDLLKQCELSVKKYAYIQPKTAQNLVILNGSMAFNEREKITHYIYIQKDYSLPIKTGEMIFQKFYSKPAKLFKIKGYQELDEYFKIDCSLQKLTLNNEFQNNTPPIKERLKCLVQ